MKNLTSKPLGVLVLSLSFLGPVLQGSVLHAQDRTEVDFERDGREHIRTIDHFVPHISTVPASRGEPVELFVRERVRGERGPPVCSVLVAAAAQAQGVSFIARRDFDGGRNPSSVAVGDFNGDGVQDLAVANQIFAGTVSVLLGNGDGTFQDLLRR